MDTLSVTLIVKAPNQQFEDQTIKCEPTWSIRKLKGYLSEVYPCNPVSQCANLHFIMNNFCVQISSSHQK